MLRRIETLIAAIVVISQTMAGASAEELATKEWQDKAVELAVAEPKVYEAMWSQSISFWVYPPDASFKA